MVKHYRTNFECEDGQSGRTWNERIKKSLAMCSRRLVAPDKSKRKNTSSLYSPKYLVLGWVFNIPFESQVGVELTTLEFDIICLI